MQAYATRKCGGTAGSVGSWKLWQLELFFTSSVPGSTKYGFNPSPLEQKTPSTKLTKTYEAPWILVSTRTRSQPVSVCLSLSLSLSLSLYIHTGMCTCTCLYIYTCVHTYIYIYTHIFLLIPVYVCVPIYHVFFLCIICLSVYLSICLVGTLQCSRMSCPFSLQEAPPKKSGELRRQKVNSTPKLLYVSLYLSVISLFVNSYLYTQHLWKYMCIHIYAYVYNTYVYILLPKQTNIKTKEENIERERDR